MMETAAQAMDVVRSAKYPPLGIRGAAFGIAHDDYAPGSMREKMDAANARTCVIAMIETALGVENIDEIAAVDGVDCLWIGPADLSCSLGVAGEFDHPLFTSAVEAIRAAARAHAKPLGCPLRNGEDAATQQRAGVSLGTFSADVALLRAALAAGVAEIRGKVAKV